jgi:hypothetical protein
MLRAKTNASVLAAGTDVPRNPLKLQNEVSLEKTSFSRFVEYFINVDNIEN